MGRYVKLIVLIVGCLSIGGVHQTWATDKDEVAARASGKEGGRHEHFQKMVELAALPEDQVHQAVQKWSRYEKASEADKERIVKRAKEVRCKLRKRALESAKEAGIRVEPEREEDFVRKFWKHRIEAEKKLQEEMAPRRKELHDEALRHVAEDFKKSEKH